MVKSNAVVGYYNVKEGTILVSHNPVKPGRKELVINLDADMEIGK